MERAALKQAVHDRMQALEEAELADAVAHYEAFLKDSQMSAREVHDKDDMVASRENADLAAAFDTPVQAHHAKIDMIENTDFSVTDTVGVGALVTLADRSFVVCVSTARFDVAGQTVMGISTQSPIYKVMAGLQAGDVFALNGKDMTIKDVC